MNAPRPSVLSLQQLRREIVVAGRLHETVWIEVPHSDRPPIVMLHEGLGSMALWKDFPQELASRTGRSLLVYSRYGHGRSEKLAEKRRVDFMHHEGQVVLPELLETLAIEKPILLGHSDGGSIALLFAARYPERVAAVVLEAPHVFVEDLSVTSIAQAKVNFTTTGFREKLSRYHAHVDETFWGWNDIWLDPGFRDWNIEEGLEAIQCPVLCIQGEQDEYGTRAQLDAIQARVPQTEIVMLPNCKHSPHRDQRELTMNHIEKFVQEIRSAGSG